MAAESAGSRAYLVPEGAAFAREQELVVDVHGRFNSQGPHAAADLKRPTGPAGKDGGGRGRGGGNAQMHKSLVDVAASIVLPIHAKEEKDVGMAMKEEAREKKWRRRRRRRTKRRRRKRGGEEAENNEVPQ